MFFQIHDNKSIELIRTGGFGVDLKYLPLIFYYFLNHLGGTLNDSNSESFEISSPNPPLKSKSFHPYTT